MYKLCLWWHKEEDDKERDTAEGQKLQNRTDSQTPLTLPLLNNNIVNTDDSLKSTEKHCYYSDSDSDYYCYYCCSCMNVHYPSFI